MSASDGRDTRSRPLVAIARKTSASVPPLSARQYEIAVLLRGGMNAGQVARFLGIALGTAKWHTSAIYKRLGIQWCHELHEVTLVKWTPAPIACARCGRLVVPLHRRQRFCSAACARPRAAAPTTCCTCGRELEPRLGAGRPHLYCSSRCKRRSPFGDRRACAHCRRTFYVPRDEATMFCSRSCAWRARPWMRTAPRRRCAWQECGASFRPIAPSEHFHSAECRRLAQLARRRAHDVDRRARAR